MNAQNVNHTQKATAAKGDATPVAAAATEKMEVEEALDEEILHMAPDDLKSRTHLLDNEIRIMRSEVDERPSEQYSDIGGCDKQIQELIEAVVPPMTHKDCFVNLGFHPPKGVLLYGPPGAKRFDSEKAGDREVQRTMLELLNQLNGFQPNDEIKSARQEIELPHPNEDARARIMQIHSRKMYVNKDVNFEGLARCTDDFNGAQCKAVCVEAGLIALRRDATEVLHEDFVDAILEVQTKKKASFNYYA
ncbi:unnamed protein product [Cylicocyclus nassatus]|uniref:AAA ATPase AAA+ lid domain-containing protein n=1 Tax=Cylicocyclus nassatus TaxID=53992 RepID=A0AA36GMK3_CYLNA|nr:unnamed protein product [Cylicocyclus nassatus]